MSNILTKTLTYAKIFFDILLIETALETEVFGRTYNEDV